MTTITVSDLADHLMFRNMSKALAPWLAEYAPNHDVDSVGMNNVFDTGDIVLKIRLKINPERFCDDHQENK